MAPRSAGGMVDGSAAESLEAASDMIVSSRVGDLAYI
jgi:hypothetical protein